ncbi:fungal-specific transcription factor domain-containing protein [Kickxella alabastrina]|uniref:fungal-specific transcription factor domain-containing protein n=1 Tax=Kickxella alabastrina TaxID=61397 RepID=UPI00221FC9FC|nr:fungal-specific transcription factor domain-containing protein [Kickxella alabastrina]KAI7823946.1 fungal-specific transcription factor domain-containing protein [Kickxella alabastrina]
MRKADDKEVSAVAAKAKLRRDAPEDGSEMDIVPDDEEEHDDHDEQECEYDGPSKLARLMRACDNCRRKKVKCNGTKPSCLHCTRMKLPCHYSPLVRKKRVRRSIIDKLEERLESMEQMLQPLVERLSPNDPVVSTGIGGIGLGFGFAPAPAPAIAHPLGMQIPGMQHSYSYGFNTGIPPGYIPQPTVHSLPRELTYQALHPGVGPPLPALAVIEELMEIAITHMAPAAPLVSWTRLVRRLHSGQLPEFIVCAMIGLAARFSNRPEFSCTPRYNAGREYAKRAAELISTLVDRPDPDVVFCMVMLSLYEWGCGRGESAWSYTGMATRLAQRCRLHLVDEEDFNENVDEQPQTWANTEWRRRLWWHVYCGDRTSVIVASRPATVHDDDCVVDLPSHDHEWITGKVPSETPKDPNARHFPDVWWQVVELYRVCSRISEFVNRRRRPVRTGEIARRTMFEILDCELEELRARFIPGMEFPPRTELLMTAFTNLGDGANGVNNICATYFNIHLMYYAAKIILYRSELPSYMHENVSPEHIDRAKAVCIDAAHNQADVIRWALDNVPVENWDPRVGVWSLQGASIHVNVAISDNTAIAEQSRRDLEVHLNLHVASDQYYHFNMAIITMLHHVFNLRKKQRITITDKTAQATQAAQKIAVATREPGITINHNSDADPWIVPRCSSFLGFTYNSSQLRGILNEAIKQTTYGPPETLASNDDYNGSNSKQSQSTVHMDIQQQQQIQMQAYHASLNSQMLAGNTLPVSLPYIGHRRMSVSAKANAFGRLDLGGNLWSGQTVTPLSIASNSPGYDITGSLPKTPNNTELSMVHENPGAAKQPMSAMPTKSAAGSLSAATDESGAKAPPRPMKRAFSSADKVAKGSGGGGSSSRGRKPNTANQAPVSVQGSGKPFAANPPQQPTGTQQLQQLQRLDELRARVVLLQQLSGQNNNAQGASTSTAALATSTAASQAVVAALLGPSNAYDSSGGVVSAGEGGRDVNGFLSNFAASIGSVASQLGSATAASAAAINQGIRSLPSSTSPPSLPSQLQQQQLPLNIHDNAWLAAALSHHMNAPAPTSNNVPAIPFDNSAIPGYDIHNGRVLTGMSNEELEMFMSQQIDMGSAVGGFVDNGIGFSQDMNSQSYQYSAVDIQGLMQRLTTFNSQGPNNDNADAR